MLRFVIVLKNTLTDDRELRSLPGVRPATRARGPGRGLQPQLRRREADRTREERGVRDGDPRSEERAAGRQRPLLGRSTPSAPREPQTNARATVVRATVSR